MKKQFNLQDWLKDKSQKVETRDGRPARIICTDAKADDGACIIALISGYGGEEAYQFFPDGRAFSSKSSDEDCADLFLVTPEPELTPLEDLLSTYLKGDFEYFSTKKWDEKKWNEVMRIQAAELLAIARKELCNRCSTGLNEYWRGRKEAMEEASRGYHYEGPYMPTYNPCHYGGECINPFHDCISCPRKSTIDINTTTGTSTAKVEG